MKRILVSVILGVLAGSILLAQGNPFLGTWKLNVAKSKYNPGPAPKSLTRTTEVQGSGEKVTNEGTAADGSRISYSYTLNYDGKDSPISGTGTPSGGDAMNTKRIDSNTTEGTTKKAGNVLTTSRLVVSKDGKVLTLTAKGPNAKGQAVSNVLVFDKQ
jgi:hypothetical protein